MDTDIPDSQIIANWLEDKRNEHYTDVEQELRTISLALMAIALQLAKMNERQN